MYKCVCVCVCNFMFATARQNERNVEKSICHKDLITKTSMKGEVLCKLEYVTLGKRVFKEKAFLILNFLYHKYI